MLGMHSEDETVEVLYDRWGKVCANLGELFSESIEAIRLVVEIDDELCKSFIVDTSVVGNLLGYLCDKRKELELVEVRHLVERRRRHRYRRDQIMSPLITNLDHSMILPIIATDMQHGLVP